ncbi:MAG: hypothetical protein H6850_00990 [Alphaproteobacteria bacterium]|nr:MAG: hypothetical protein H6850_00990 [Alphaproteobacteria bacterium]
MKLKQLLILGIILLCLVKILFFIPNFDIAATYFPDMPSEKNSAIKMFLKIKHTIPFMQYILGICALGVTQAIHILIAYFCARIVQAENFKAMIAILPKISYAFLGLAIWDFLLEPLFGLITFWHFKKGEGGFISVIINNDQIQFLIIAGLLVLLMQHMKKAYELEKETELTV